MQATIHISPRDLGPLVLEGLQRRIEDRVRDMRPAWDGVLTAIYEQEKKVFAAEGQTVEEPRWAPNKNGGARFHGGIGYSHWKLLNYPAAKTLHLTGKLEAQLTGEGGAFVVRLPDALVFGTNYRDYSGAPAAAGRPRPSPPNPGGDRLTGDLGGITAEGRKDYYPMEPRTPIRLDAHADGEIAMPIMDHLFAVGMTIPGSRPLSSSSPTSRPSGRSSWNDPAGSWGAAQEAGSRAKARAMRAWGERHGF